MVLVGYSWPFFKGLSSKFIKFSLFASLFSTLAQLSAIGGLETTERQFLEQLGASQSGGVWWPMASWFDDMLWKIWWNCGTPCPKSKALITVNILHGKFVVLYQKDGVFERGWTSKHVWFLGPMSGSLPRWGFCPTIHSRWFSTSSTGWGLGNSSDGNPYAYLPASSKWPFDHPNGGHLSPEKVT